jgi:hypothetical protein
LNRNAILLGLTALAAVFFLAFGLWAFFDPQSFYDNVAEFEPYNEHFIHDLGAFQVGLGAVLGLALWRRNDAIFAAMGGVGVGSAVHVVGHIIDDELGGTTAQTVSLAVVAVVLLAGAAWRLAGERR